MPFQLQSIKDQIAELQRQLQCILSGDCCGASASTLYNEDSVTTDLVRNAEIAGQLNFTDGTTPNVQLLRSGNVYLSLVGAGNTGIGISTPVAKLSIRSNGATTGQLFRGENLTGSLKVNILDNGKTTFNINTRDDSAFSIGANEGSKTGLYIDNITECVLSEVYGIDSNIRSSAIDTSNAFIGIKGSTDLNGNKKNIGVVGVSTSALTGLGFYDEVVNASYLAGVKGASSEKSGEDSTSMGGYFTAGILADSARENTYIGVYGEAVARGGIATLIGGIFRTRDVSPVENTSLKHIALLVPATDNLGIVVINADDVSGLDKAQMEVTGNIQSIGAGNGFIVRDEINGNDYKITTVSGVLTVTIV